MTTDAVSGKIILIMATNWNFPEYPDNWDEITAEVKQRDGHQCVDCGATGVVLQAHHIRSLSRGGTNQLSNLKSVCEKCHARYHPHMDAPPTNTVVQRKKPSRKTGKPTMYCPPPKTEREVSLPSESHEYGESSRQAKGGRTGTPGRSEKKGCVGMVFFGIAAVVFLVAIGVSSAV